MKDLTFGGDTPAQLEDPNDPADQQSLPPGLRRLLETSISDHPETASLWRKIQREQDNLMITDIFRKFQD